MQWAFAFLCNFPKSTVSNNNNKKKNFYLTVLKIFESIADLMLAFILFP